MPKLDDWTLFFRYLKKQIFGWGQSCTDFSNSVGMNRFRNAYIYFSFDYFQCFDIQKYTFIIEDKNI